MKKNQQELMDLMYHNKLLAKDVADLLYCTPNNVRVWRCNNGNAMPDAKLELLKFKLTEKKL
jgi:uncharacterized protein YjcR